MTTQTALWPAACVPRHPARYTSSLLPLFAAILRRYGAHRVLDPMAGTCRLVEVRRYGFAGVIVCNELEPEWAVAGVGAADLVTVADAARLPFANASFDAIVTSPTYGNRLADHHNARDASRRRSYTHDLGRPLHPANTGQLQWGEAYRAAHLRIWAECARVLRPDGMFVLNISDHIRDGRVVPVAAWHRDALMGLGFDVLEEHRVPTPRLRYGENAERRVEHEVVWVMRRDSS